jgi:hypothetical protein
VVLHAQFWAEDGIVWYRDAYTLGGLNALLLPRDGYFQTISRLTAALAQPLPLIAAPYLFNLVALFWQVLPAMYLVSPRVAPLIPSTWTRLLLAFVYLALPNAIEVHVNVTNAQSHLALLALMLVLCPPGPSRWARAADAAILLLAGLSTIMCTFLVPVAAVMWYRRRTRWDAVVLVLTGATGVIQLVGLATGPDTRAHDPLGASVELFLRIVGAQVVLSPLVGARGYEWIVEQRQNWVVLAAGVVGALVFACAALKGALELRLFLFFAACILGVALFFGQVQSAGDGAWAVLLNPEAGARYFFFPSLAFVLSLLWMASRHHPPIARVTACGLLSVMLLVGILFDWRMPPLADLAFATHAERFERAPAGTHVLIPVNPEGSTMELVKR